jgi:pimeloyl-ACP methyl ester carboxylesterase/membrane-associated phospholipid phosphatase
LSFVPRREHLEQVAIAVQAGDDRAMRWIATVDHGRVRPALVAAARAGDVLAPVVAASLWVVIDGTPDERAAVLWGWAVMAVAATIENGLVKPAVERGRPDAQRLPPGQRRSSPPSTSSLPAGHTGSVAAFSVATGRNVPRLRGWLAASTILLAYSHVYTGRHYLSDVVIGAAMGATVGGLCRRPSHGPAAERHAVPLRSAQDASARACVSGNGGRMLVSHRIRVDDDTIHSRETADASAAEGPHIILVHGVGATARYFVPLLQELAGRAPAAAVELPGIGSSTSSELPRDVPQQADALAAWLRATGRHPAILVGNSMGAQTVVEVAIRHPELAERLVLIGPTMDPAARTPLRQIGRLLVDATVERPSLIAVTLSDSFLTKRRAVHRYLLAALDHHIEARVPLVTVPILVIRGSRDPVVPRRWARALATAAPHGQFVEVPGAAHATHHGRPRLVAQLLLEEISTAETRSPGP